MEKKEIKVEVPASVYELGQELKNLVKQIAEVTKDGVQLSDLAVLLPYITRLNELKSKISELPEAVKDHWGFAKALLLSLEGIEKPFLSAEPAVAQDVPASQ